MDLAQRINFGNAALIDMRTLGPLLRRLLGRDEAAAAEPVRPDRVGLLLRGDRLVGVRAPKSGARTALQTQALDSPRDLGPALAAIVTAMRCHGEKALCVVDDDSYELARFDADGLAPEDLRQALRYRAEAMRGEDAGQLCAAGQLLARGRNFAARAAAVGAIGSRERLERVGEMVQLTGLRLNGMLPLEFVMAELAARMDPRAEGIALVAVRARRLSIIVAAGDELYVARQLTPAWLEDGTPDAVSLAEEVQRVIDFYERRLASRDLGRCVVLPCAGQAQLVDDLRAGVSAPVEAADTALLCAGAALPDDELVDAWPAIAAAQPRASDLLLSMYEPPERQTGGPTLPWRGIAAFAGFCVLLLAASWIQGALTEGLHDDAAAARAAQIALSTEVAALDTEEEIEAREPDPALVQRLEDTRFLGDFYASVLRDFEAVDLGVAGGFSAPLRALARRPVDGVWLSRIRMDSASVRFEGATLDALGAGDFDRALERAGAFARWDLAELAVSDGGRGADGTGALRFSLSGTAVDDATLARSADGRDADLSSRLFEMLRGRRRSD